MQPDVVLIGPPGAGKSTTGELLAKLLDRPFLDTDDLITERAGKPVSEIFFDNGEPAFRALEASAVADSLLQASGVVSLGGGAVMTPQVEQDLSAYRERGGVVIFLDVSLAQASGRIGFNASRPLLLGNPRAQWQRLMGVRRPVYTRCADHTVDTNHKKPAVIAEAIYRLLKEEDGQQ